jgi:hypothetical protein
MNLYNPFKWHIVKDNNDTYYIRKLTFLSGYAYLDIEDNFEWSSYTYHNARYDSFDQAFKRFNDTINKSFTKVYP